MAKKKRELPEVVTQEDIDNAALVFAKFAKLLDPNLDEWFSFELVRETLIEEGGIDLKNIAEVAEALKAQRFDPNVHTLH